MIKKFDGLLLLIMRREKDKFKQEINRLSQEERGYFLEWVKPLISKHERSLFLK